nr:hypothetical protein 1 [bacterium]
MCIRDRFGHLAGDKVLKATAEILTQSVRNIDIVARFGGDEFVVVAPHTDKDEALKIKNRIIEVTQKHSQNQGILPFTLSIGTHSAEPGATADILLQVDAALYREKDMKGDQELQTLEQNLQDILDKTPLTGQ